MTRRSQAALAEIGLLLTMAGTLAACEITIKSDDETDTESVEAMESSAHGADAAADAGPAEDGDGGASEGGSNGSSGDAGGGAAADADVQQDAGPPAPVLDEVETVGVGVSADRFCTEGLFTVTIQPSDTEGGLFIPAAANVACEASAEGQAIDCAVSDVACMSGTSSSQARTALLVILDDSSSMDRNDPEKLRAQACMSFVEKISDGESVAVTDFGHGGTSPARALRTLQDFTADVSAASMACAAIETGPQGTPIYGSMVDAIDVFLVAAREKLGANANFAVLMLSDGEPDADTSDRQTALSLLRQALVPVFTVGLGPAAEGDDNADPTAIATLQELSQETGGAYTSSIDPEGLEALFDQVASALRKGRCMVTATLSTESFMTGQTITGLVTLEDGAVSSSYSFMIPASDVSNSKCAE